MVSNCFYARSEDPVERDGRGYRIGDHVHTAPTHGRDHTEFGLSLIHRSRWDTDADWQRFQDPRFEQHRGVYRPERYHQCCGGHVKLDDAHGSGALDRN